MPGKLDKRYARKTGNFEKQFISKVNYSCIFFDEYVSTILSKIFNEFN